MKDLRRLRVTLVYEYDVYPEHYIDGNDPLVMAREDLEGDPSVVLDAEWELEGAVFRSRRTAE